MNPYLIVGVLVAAIALFGGGYAKGYRDMSNACEAAKVAQMEADAKAKDAKAVKVNKESEKLEVSNAKARVVYRTITQTVDKIVERPVYRNVCLDDDGLRAIAAALAANRPAAGKLDATLPGPDAAK